MKNLSVRGMQPLMVKPIQARQCGRSYPIRINGILVYQMVDMEMVDHARGCPIYTIDYFTMAVTSEYLESLQEEFQI